MRVSRRGAIVALAAVSLSSAAAVAATADASQSVWAATATKAVTFKGLKLGRTATATPLHLAIALHSRNSAAEAAAMRAIYTPGSATYHHYLTPSEWNAAYAPSTSDVAAVTKYLRAEGFSHIAVGGDRLLITADGLASTAERAFHTSLVSYRLGGKLVYGNTSPAMVPTALSGVVSAVIGLNDLPLDNIKTEIEHPAKTKAGSPDLLEGLYPKQFEHTYDAVGTESGRKTSIAILSEGAPKPVVTTLRYAEKMEKSPKIPVTIEKVGEQSTDTSGADEFDMDSQTSTMVSGGVKMLYMYNIGGLVDPDIDAAFDAFVSQDKATALSASVGGCEVNAYLDGSEIATDTVMQQAAMQGQSIFASSGDNGDACMYVAAIGAPAGVPGVNWPASGEFTTAVGGTSLIVDSKGNRISELAWAGSGGGISELENAGWWTQDTDPAYVVTQAASGGRAVPDVALDADPNVATPEMVYVGKTISLTGGTSLSSPMMLGFWARLESAHGNKLGLAAPALYAVYDKVNPGTHVTVPDLGLPEVVPSADPKSVYGFHDIILGVNGTYSALPGYDLTTGLGAPDVKQLDKVLN